MKQDKRTLAAALICLALVLVLGFFLRAHRLSEQSVWYDEICAIPLDASTPFPAYWERIRATNPDHMPLYFLVIYAWGQVAGVDPYWGRILSITLSLGAAAMLFLIGRRSFGVWAAVLAVLFHVISPNQVNCDQGLRAYSILLPLSAMSIYTFLRASEGGQRHWWLFNLLVNNLLVWTHLAATCIPICQGIALLVTYILSNRIRSGQTTFRLLFNWSLAHLSLGAAGAYWINSLAKNPPLNWYKPMTFKGYLNDLLGDDYLSLNPHFGVAEAIWQQVRVLWPGWLQGIEMAGAIGVLLLGALGILFGVRLFLGAFRATGTSMPSHLNARTIIFFLTLTVVPPTAMALVSQLNPVYMPRYTQYSSMTLHLFVGAAIMSLRWVFLRRVIIAGACAAYATQLFWILTTPVREQWNEVAKEIRTYWTPRDLVLVSGELGHWPGATSRILLEYNLHSPEIQVEQAACISGMAALARHHLVCEATRGGVVWLVVEDLVQTEKIEEARAAFARNGLEAMTMSFTLLQLHRLQLPVNNRTAHIQESPCVVDFADSGTIEIGNREWLIRVLEASCLACSDGVPAVVDIRAAEQAARLDIGIGDQLAALILERDPVNYRAHVIRIAAAAARRDIATMQAMIQRAKSIPEFQMHHDVELSEKSPEEVIARLRDAGYMGDFYFGPSYLFAMAEGYPSQLLCNDASGLPTIGMQP